MIKSNYSVLIIFFFLLISTDLQSSELQILFYNVRNLFDTLPDHGKKDWAYLPKESPAKKKCRKISERIYRRTCFSRNWTEQKLYNKIKNLGKVLDTANADIIGLAEVENTNVLAMLAREAGYDRYLITKGNDERGIDQALLFRSSKDLRMIKSFELSLGPQLRPALIVDFLWKKKYHFRLAVNHWPSQRSGVEARIAASKTLVKKLKGFKHSLLLLGDFNATRSDWALIEKEGWPFLTNSDAIFPMTYFYAQKMRWHSFDRFYWNKFLQDGKGLEIKDRSFSSFKPGFSKSVYEYDERERAFYGSRIVGVPNHKYSDHFPIALSLISID